MFVVYISRPLSKCVANSYIAISTTVPRRIYRSRNLASRLQRLNSSQHRSNFLDNLLRGRGGDGMRSASSSVPVVGASKARHGAPPAG